MPKSGNFSPAFSGSLTPAATFAAFQLTSCKNFLNAGKVSDEIKDVIAYNNAKTVNISIECKEDMGTVFPQLNYQAKVGYPFEVQFIPNIENYTIKDPATIFKAVSRIDKEQSRNNCVEFKVLDQTFEDKKSGLYRIQVKVTTYADDIQITPDCIPCPAIKSTSPEHSSTGHYANTPVIITFNVPIEDDNGNEGVFNYSENNISIISSEGDMSKYFDKPVLNSDNTRLTLIPKAKELSNYISNKNLDYLDLKISFSPKISIIQSGVKLSFVQNEYSDFTVRYMEKMEKTAPVLVPDTFFATRHSLSLSEAETFAQEKFLLKTLGNFANDNDYEYLQNRIRNELYICGKYYDAESGVRCIKVSAQLTNEYSLGSAVNVPAESYTFYVSEINSKAELLRDDKGNVSFCVKVDNLDVFENGAVKITVKALDYCNNVSEVQTFTVFKKSFGDEVFDSIEVGNAKTFQDWFPYESRYREYSENDYDDLLKTLYIEDNKVTQQLYYGSKQVLIPVQNYTFKCIYKEKNGNSDEFVFVPNVTPYGLLTAEKKLDLNSISGLSFTIIISDDIGNIARKDFKIPDNDKIATVVTMLNSGYKGQVELLYLYSEDEEIVPLSFPSIWIYEDKNTHEKMAMSQNPTAQLQEGTYNYIVHWGDSVKDLKLHAHFFSEVSKNTQTVTIVNDTKTINCNSSIKKSDEDGWLDVTVTINQNQNFDNYYLKYPVVTRETEDVYDSGPWNYHFFEPGEMSYTFKTSTRAYFKSWLGFYFYLYGIKDGIGYSKEVKINESPDIEYDNYLPSYEIRREKYTYYQFVAVDVGSGIQKGTVTVNRTGHKFDFSDDGTGYSFVASVPIQELLLGNNSVTVNIKDKQNNSLEKQDNIYLDYDPLTFEKAEKKNAYWWFTTGVDNDEHYASELDVQWTYLNTSDDNPQWSDIDDPPTATRIKNSDNSYLMKIQKSYIFGDNNDYSFLKIMTVTRLRYNNNTFGGAPLYIYAGDANPNGFYDYILPNTNESVLVMSDGPTYIHAVSTPTDYYECKDWSIAQWETYNHTFGDVYWSGSSTVPRNYKIDMDEILPGESYCVIAYFVKGKPAKSAVMVKQ